MKRKHIRFITGILVGTLLSGNIGGFYSFAAEGIGTAEISYTVEQDEASNNIAQYAKSEETNEKSINVSDSSDKKNERILPENKTYTYKYDDYSVEYTVTSQWDENCNVSVKMTNLSDKVIHNWNLAFATDDMILNPYNTKLLTMETVEGRYIFKNMGFNQDIAVGGNVQFGFRVDYGESFDLPEDFYMSSSESGVALSDYSVEVIINSDWGTGRTGEIRIKNLRNTTIEDWVLTVQTKGNIINVWDAEIEKTSDSLYEISCSSYSQNVSIGTTAVIGFQMEGEETEITVLGLRERNHGDEANYTDASENSVSHNKIYGKYIQLNTEDFDTTSKYPVITDEKTSINGSLFHPDEVMSISYEIKDVLDTTVKRGTLEIDGEFWKADNIGFAIGKNELNFYIERKDDTVVEESIRVVNSYTDNLLYTDVDLDDSDKDGILNYFEAFYYTDYMSWDTDLDGLSDGEEAFFTNSDPAIYDSIKEGIADGDVDLDDDGLSNAEEMAIDSDPDNPDTDYDGLNDGYEHNTSKTNPLEYDTDFDGFSDKEEIDLGLNPISIDSDGNGVADGNEVIHQEKTRTFDNSPVKEIAVTLDCEGSLNEKMRLSKIKDSHSVVRNVAGLVGEPVEINCEADFSTAEIKFTYDETMLGDTKESDLRMMWYDEANNNFVLLEDAVVDTENNTVTYNTTHFSTYFLLDFWVWQAIRGERIDYMTYPIDRIKETYDFVVIIDYTVSYADLNREELIATSIIDQMEDGDRMTILYAVDNNMKFKGTSINWSTTKASASSYINPNSAFSFFTGDGLNPTGAYNADSYLTFLLDDHLPNSTNKKMTYLIYPGSQYESMFSNNYSKMNQYVNKIKTKGNIVNAISLSSNISSSLDKCVKMTGGKQYTGSNEEIRNSISSDLATRIDYGTSFFDDTDGDKDGLPDVYEVRGMRGKNGHLYYSDPGSEDTDGDGHTDFEEIGEYDSDTGLFNTVSDPANKYSNEDGYYVIGWSYSADHDVLPFERNVQEIASLLDWSGKPDGSTVDWSSKMWDSFAYNNAFSRAAQTKRRELLAKGIEDDDIIVKRMDDIESAKRIWNYELTEIDHVKEFHLYSHGKPGSPEFYRGSKIYIGDANHFKKLNWMPDAEAYFYGCRIAIVPDEQYNAIDTFAKEQKVVTYANKYRSRFSADPDEKKIIDVLGLSQDVYLNNYGIPDEDVKDEVYPVDKKIQKAYGNKLIPMVRIDP